MGDSECGSESERQRERGGVRGGQWAEERERERENEREREREMNESERDRDT